VDTGHWQALKDVPHTKTIELRDVIVEYEIPGNQEALAVDIRPNLPWAEDHFRERVCGVPLNPGVQYKNWPWYKPDWEAQNEKQEFSHTYMERFWGKSAIRSNEIRVYEPFEPDGIRYDYGDLNDVVDLLAREPYTRQAYLPIWFPEDTGAVHGERVPCTLGYHFMLRDGKLNCNYVIRSCDFLRYLRDDLYMAARLTQWVLDTLVPRRMGEYADERDRAADHPWARVEYGKVRMSIFSLHIFEGDLPKMRREYGTDR
jgi:hypothetical protein